MATYYTFSTLGTDGKKYYPKEYQWKKEGCKPGTGLLDFDWTTDIKEAKKWRAVEDFDIIMAEFCDTEVVKLEE